ncbi:MAG: hypothetical protein CVT98_07370, partial [Bacteroidetes bacterium HGW-Bacteroidetes-15]
MTLNDKVKALHSLGDIILRETKSPQSKLFWEVLNSANIYNPWFTPEFCNYSITSIASQWLNSSALNQWINQYPQSHFSPNVSNRVGVVMAGNVPFVGFHDML